MLRLGFTTNLLLSTSLLTSCLVKMPTEPVLLPPQLCSDCGQWSARVCLLCHWHNQNSLRPVRLWRPKLYLSHTFRTPLLLPLPLTYPLPRMKERDRKTEKESEGENIQYEMLSPIESMWKAAFLSVHTDIFENMFMCPFTRALSHHFLKVCYPHTNDQTRNMVKEKIVLIQYMNRELAVGCSQEQALTASECGENIIYFCLKRFESSPLKANWGLNATLVATSVSEKKKDFSPNVLPK